MSTIDAYREQINVLDKQIVELIEKRMDVAVGIGIEKKKLGLPVFDGAREKNRLETVRKLATNDLYRDHLPVIYETIMKETKIVEQKIMDEE